MGRCWNSYFSRAKVEAFTSYFLVDELEVGTRVLYTPVERLMNWAVPVYDVVADKSGTYNGIYIYIYLQTKNTTFLVENTNKTKVARSADVIAHVCDISGVYP